MKKVFKWIGIVLGSLVGLLLVAFTVLYFMGKSQLDHVYDFPPSNLTIPTDDASIAHGQHIAVTLCEGCHGADLSGINDWFNGGPIGTIDSANLTTGAGGVGKTFTDEDYVRAIRHGVDPQGKPTFMPGVLSTSNLSDEDLADVIAYVKTVPPVDHTTYGKQFKPLAMILEALGQVQFPVEVVSHEVHVTAPLPGVTVEYGAYIVNTHDCRVCHGPNMNGGKFPDPTSKIITPNLTQGGDLSTWTQADFIKTIRTSVTPHGHNLDPNLMPWKEFRNMTDDELQAIWAYLISLPKMDQYVP